MRQMPMQAAPERVLQRWLDNPYALPALTRDVQRDRMALEAWLEVQARNPQPNAARPRLERAVLALACIEAHTHAVERHEGHVLTGRSREEMLAAFRLTREPFAQVAAAALRAQRALGALHGISAAMQRVRREVWSACFGNSLYHALKLPRVIHDHDVLITGETGTGKEAVARVLIQGHLGGQGSEPAPHAAINAAAVPDALIESELFGHVRGAFTGASSDRGGRLRLAHQGCFFLDEIGDLPLSAQAKLLRVMETNEVAPIGADRDVAVDVRYVGATHHDLQASIAQGRFRADLYQRIAGCVIHLPPLRERPEDILGIGLAFVDSYCAGDAALAEDRARIAELLQGRTFQRRPWAGNVRELENVLRDMMLGLLPADPASSKSSPSRRPRAHSADPSELPTAVARGDASLAQVRQWYVRSVLKRSAGNHTRAAQILRVDRSTLRRYLGD